MNECKKLCSQKTKQMNKQTNAHSALIYPALTKQAIRLPLAAYSELVGNALWAKCSVFIYFVLQALICILIEL